MQQVREEAAHDFGNFRTAHVLASRNTSFPCGKNSLPNMGNIRGDLDDVFTPAPIGTLGTGPGVIPVDTFWSYSNNMGQPARGIKNSGVVLNSGSARAFFNSNRNKQFSNRALDHNLFHHQQQRPQRQNNLRLTSSNITRDLPPRFLKTSLQTPTGITKEISLHPAQNSMIGKGKLVSAPFVKTSLTSVPLSLGEGTNSTLLPNALPTMQKEQSLQQERGNIYYRQLSSHQQQKITGNLTLRQELEQISLAVDEIMKSAAKAPSNRVFSISVGFHPNRGEVEIAPIK